MGDQISGSDKPIDGDIFHKCIDNYVDADTKLEDKSEQSLNEFGAIYVNFPNFSVQASDYRDDKPLQEVTSNLNNRGNDYELFRKRSKGLEFLLFFPKDKMLLAKTEIEPGKSKPTNIQRMRDLSRQIILDNPEALTKIIYKDESYTGMTHTLLQNKLESKDKELIFSYKLKEIC